MTDISRVTNEEVLLAVATLKKIEAADVFCGDDREDYFLKFVRQHLEEFVVGDRFQKYQDDVFESRAEEALLDDDQEAHEKWKSLIRKK